MRDLALPIVVSALLHGAIVVAIPTVIDGPRLEQVSADAIEVVLAAGAPMAAQPVTEPAARVAASVAETARADLVSVDPPTRHAAPAATLAASDVAAAPRAPISPAPGTVSDAPTPPESIVPRATAADVDPVVVPTSDLPTAPSSGGAPRGDRRAAVIPGANPSPTYPPLARRRGVEGTVILRVQVRPDGTCAEVVITRTSGSTLLDRAARRAVTRWRFAPARRSGEPIPDWLEVPVEFHLVDSD